MRPPEEEARNLHLYELAHGLKVPITLVAVNEMHNWTVEHATAKPPAWTDCRTQISVACSPRAGTGKCAPAVSSLP